MVYTQSIDWTEFYAELDRVLAQMEGERFEAIVAIAQGGIIPAALIQQEWGIPMGVVHINYRDHENKPRFADARLLDEGPPPFVRKKVLLVDDVSRTGRTLARARAYLAESTVKTFLVNGEADFRLYRTEECLRMPWKRD
ncbi:MAG: phosphoribosyltransferase [Spirochaetia bacterium]|jgi:xanthine phosphoribosyltransferase